MEDLLTTEVFSVLLILFLAPLVIELLDASVQGKRHAGRLSVDKDIPGTFSRPVPEYPCL